jgi:hypothetical protein
LLAQGTRRFAHQCHSIATSVLQIFCKLCAAVAGGVCATAAAGFLPRRRAEATRRFRSEKSEMKQDIYQDSVDDRSKIHAPAQAAGILVGNSKRRLVAISSSHFHFAVQRIAAPTYPQARGARGGLMTGATEKRCRAPRPC